MSDFAELFSAALLRRREFLELPHNCSCRLFDGFSEKYPGLTCDLFAKTAVVTLYRADTPLPEYLIAEVCRQLPFIKCIVVKKKFSSLANERNGEIVYGIKPDDTICENGVRYALELMLNQDNSFYGDTRLLRSYLLQHSAGKRVLNTFAYTGSLGVAAACGGAAQVVQTDLNERFMSLAKRSYSLNNIYYNKKSFICGNFFPVAARFKQRGELFDTVILDPPFFSASGAGNVDLAAEPERLINKVRPLVADGGRLIVVNNSLFLAGRDFMTKLETLCADNPYLAVEEIIPVPEDHCGPFPQPVTPPEPFNHPTKIVVLAVKRKG
jgi:23S rRNA (cytosine1962-C5)-methyltransferase